MSVNSVQFSSYLHNVASTLRRQHKLSRLAAEWFCFRNAGAIQADYNRRIDFGATADLTYTAWHQWGQREFLTLISDYAVRKP